VAPAQGHALGRKLVAQRLKAAQLLAVEVRVLGERHHGARDRHAAPPPEVAEESGRLAIRHPHAADPGVDADVQRHRPPAAGRDPIEGRAHGRIDHRLDAERHRMLEVAFTERPHAEDRLAHAGVAQRRRLVQLDHREAGDGRLLLDGLRSGGHAQAVSVVLDDGQALSPARPAVDLRHVVPPMIRADLDPGVEGGMLDGMRPR
jgi:hypothetical protein